MDDQPRNTPVSVGVYNNAKEITKERTDHEQATCTDMKSSLSRFPFNDSVSIAHTKSVTLMVSSSSVVLVGQSSIEQVNNDHCCGQEKLSREQKPIAERQTQMELFPSVLKNRCP